jgi:RHS repeat-associated protein
MPQRSSLWGKVKKLIRVLFGWGVAKRPRQRRVLRVESLESRQLLTGMPLYWDPSDGTGSSMGGVGTWNTSALVWSTSSTGGGTLQAWSNTSGDTAVFPGTAGSVTVASGIVAGEVQFTASGYTLGSGSIAITGTGQIDVASGLSETISSTLNGSNGLTKTSAGNLTLSAANTYTGGTNIFGGTITAGIASALPTSTAVIIGDSSGDTGNLDLSSYSQTVGSLTVASDSSNVNTITIGSGQTLTVDGLFTVGVNHAAGSVTNLTVTGAGTLNVQDSGGTFTVGGATGSTNTDSVTINMTGLANFTANLGSTGTFRVGDAATTSSGSRGASTVKLATNSTIIANLLGIGDITGEYASMALDLGSGTNIIDANTVTLGAAPGGGVSERGCGNLGWASGVTTGSVAINNAAGTGAAALNVGNVTADTSATLTSTFNVTGHSANLDFGAVNIGNRVLSAVSSSAGSSAGTFMFDTGSLVMGAVVMAERKDVNDTKGVTAALAIAGGTATIGSIQMAQNDNEGAGSATATVSFTAGTITMGGSITKLGGTEPTSATFTLNGATLNMAGYNIGSATNIDTLNFQSGTLENVAQINNGAGLTKTGSGTLTLQTSGSGGTNAYSGGTAVDGGELLVDNTSGAGTGSGPVSVATAAILGGTGSISGAVTVYPGGIISPGNSGIGTLSIYNSLLLEGTVDMDIDQTTNTSDLLQDLTSVTYGGTLAVTNLAGTLAQGDTFTLFNATTYHGSFSSTTLPTVGSSLAWVDTGLNTTGTISLSGETQCTCSCEMDTVTGAGVTPTGQVQLSTTPVTSGGSLTSTSANGQSFQIDQPERLSVDSTALAITSQTGQTQVWNVSGSTYTPVNAVADGSMASGTNSYGNTYVQTDPSGTQYVFAGAGASGYQLGQLEEMIPVGTGAVDYSYSTDGQIAQTVTQTGGGYETIATYTENTSTVKITGETVATTNGTTTTTVGSAALTYYGTGDSSGNPGDIQFVQSFTGSDTTDPTDTTYYRYYTGAYVANSSSEFNPATNPGLPNQVKFILSGASVNRLMTAYGLTSISALDGLTDAEVYPYSDNYFQYTSAGVVSGQTTGGTGCSVCGGEGITGYSVTFSGSTTMSRNDWFSCSVETRADGSVVTTYDNSAKQVILQDTWNGLSGSVSQHSITYNEYDSNGNVTLAAQPSAVSGYSVSGTSLTVTLNASTGLINVNQYYSSTTATSTTPGGVLGYLQQSGVKQGSGGSTVWQSSVDYIAQTLNGITVYYTNSSTSYGTAGGDPRTTTYAYPFFASGVLPTGSGPVVSSMTTLMPPVTSADHGSNDALSVSSLTQSSGVATATTSAAHGYATGDWVFIQGATPSGYDGWFEITAVPSSTTFTYAVPSGLASTASGTITAQTTAASTESDDTLGRVVWTKDASGSIGYTAYDPATGAVTRQIDDVNLSLGPTAGGYDTTYETWGWTSPSGAQNLTTNYTVDAQGRTTKEVDPDGDTTYTIYNDANRETLVYPGWHYDATAGVYQTTGPVQVYREDWANGYTETLTYSLTGGWSGANVTSGAPNGAEVTGTGTFAATNVVIQSLSRSILNASGQVVKELDYTSLTGSYSASSNAFGNYLETDYTFDTMGRAESTTDPTGLITFTTYDYLGNVTGQWQGTDDVPSYDWDGSGTVNMLDFRYWVNNVATTSDVVGPAGTNMMKISANVYDADSNLVESDAYTDPTGVSAPRVTYYGNDWRDRQVYMVNPPDASGNVTYTMTTYDNQDEAVETQQYWYKGTDLAADLAAAVAASTSTTLNTSDVLLSQSTSAYDDRGQVYQIEQYGVDASTGTADSGPLVSNSWYDPRGNVIKYQPLGSSTFTFSQYNSDDELTVQYVGTDTVDTGYPSLTAPVANATVYEQTEDQYDADGNVIFEIDRERSASTTGTGALDAANSRSTYVGMWYDQAGRRIETANFGTAAPGSGGTEVPPSTAPTLTSNPSGAEITTTGYDAAGNAAYSTDPLGHVSYSTFNMLGQNLESIQNYVSGGTDSDENSTTVTDYNSAGQVSEVVDPNGHGTNLYYDSLGRQDETVDAAGDTTTEAYDLQGEVTAQTSPTGVVTTTAYDSLGRPVATAVGSIATTETSTWSYTQLTPNSAGTYTIYVQYPSSAPPTDLIGDYAVTDGSGTTLTVTAPSSTASPLGAGWYALGTVTVPGGDDGTALTITFTSGTDTQASAVCVVATNSTTAYNLLGDVSSQTDALGHTTSDGYDDFNRQSSVTDANSNTTHYTYFTNGDMQSLTDSDGNVTAWTYDPLDRVLTETSPSSGVTTSTYDGGNLSSVEDADGRVTDYTFDQFNRESTESFYASMTATTPTETIGFGYDLDNQLLSATDSLSGSDSYVYNGLSQVIAGSQAVTGLTPTVTLVSAYNSGGDRTQLAANIGGTVDTTTGVVTGGTNDFVNNYTFDTVDRMTEETQSGVTGGNAVTAKRVDFTYFADGQFQTITMRQSLSGTAPDVATSTFGYDNVGRLTSLTQQQDYTSTTFASYAWTYNADDTVKTFTNSVHSTEDAAYTYDPTGQLTAATYVNDMANNATYGFDANGNLNTGGSTVSSPASSTGANQISTDGTYNYYYDADGNLISKVTIADSSEVDYAFDNRNRMTSVTNKDSSGRITQVVSYLYDASNRLVSRTLTVNTYVGTSTTPATTTTTTGNFIYDGNSIVLQLDDSGDVVTRVLNGAAVDQVFAQEDSSGTVTWALSDNQNTVRDLLQFSGTTTTDVDHRSYNAFGAPLSTPAVDLLFGYTGKYYDQATGLQWNLNRWYNPTLQRWMNQDPSGLEADSNPYRYCGNGPTDATDPTGLFDCDWSEHQRNVTITGFGPPGVRIVINWWGTGSAFEALPPDVKDKVKAVKKAVEEFAGKVGEKLLDKYTKKAIKYAEKKAEEFLNDNDWPSIDEIKKQISDSAPGIKVVQATHISSIDIFIDGTVYYKWNRKSPCGTREHGSGSKSVTVLALHAFNPQNDAIFVLDKDFFDLYKKLLSQAKQIKPEQVLENEFKKQYSSGDPNVIYEGEPGYHSDDE